MEVTSAYGAERPDCPGTILQPDLFSYLQIDGRSEIWKYYKLS